jgi:cell wall-associated NlpC family hydrolase
VLTKDDAVPHHTAVLDDAVFRKPRSSRFALAGRAAVVAGSTAAAAVLTLLPAAPTAIPATPPAAPIVTVTTPVVRLAVTEPAAVTLNLQAATAAAAPAAVRTAALQKALGKIGARYRYGAAGPNAFDCSGLVTWAYRNSGKGLPRSSRAMAHVGTPVSKSALQPGDLVFFYRGPSHVAIYVGNGKVVHASTPRHPVRIADLNSMPFNSARRV